jgi:phytoene dehydrogenase-like protein
VDMPSPALKWRSIVSLAYDASRSPLRQTVVALNGKRTGPVNHMAVVSDAQPSLAPAGRSLVLATVIGHDQRDDASLDGAARAQLGEWFESDTTNQWTLLRVDRIARALPDQSAGWLEPRRRPNQIDGVWLAGDHLDNASINGAMESGRRAAEMMLAEG